MTKKRDLAAEYCQDWVRWCHTRGMYAPKAGSSLLGRMQPAKTGREPNARNHPDMMYFNMAIHALADMPRWSGRYKAFFAYYVADAASAKRAADEMGIGLRTYYDHVKAFADEAYRLMPSIKRSHESNFGAPPQPPASAPRHLARPGR